MANIQLKAWRNGLKLSQQAIADKIGITRETYSSYEQGRRMPTVYSLFEMEKVFGVPARIIYESFDGFLADDSSKGGKSSSSSWVWSPSFFFSRIALVRLT